METEILQKLANLKINGNLNVLEHIKQVLKLMTLCKEKDPYENFEKYSEAVTNN